MGMSDRTLEEYYPEIFIKRIADMDWKDILILCHDKSNFLKNRRGSKKREDEYQESVIRKFDEFLGGLMFMIVHGNKIKPAGMELSDFLATKIVFQNLIEKKQWDEGWMDLYAKYER